MGIYERDYMRRRREPPSLSPALLIGILASIVLVIGTAMYFGGRTDSHGHRTTRSVTERHPEPTPFHQINVNTATAKELEAIPYLSMRTKQLIIAHRPYAAPEDLMKVPGIKERTLERIRPYITVQ
jgi:DNA uptake protein ComE-like DNA-binding protein